MTTAQAAAQYLREPERQWSGLPVAVFNPNGREFADLPVIYGFNNGGSPGWLNAALIAEDGEVLGGHICSAEGYMPYDLGIIEGSREDRHEGFRQKYPDGYRMEFVGSGDVPTHAGLNTAFERSKSRADPAA